MQLSFDLIEVQSFEESRTRPASLLNREPGESWLIRAYPIGFEGDEGVLWEWCSDGDYVRVPLFNYLTSDTDPATAMGFASQLGLCAATAAVAFAKVLPSRLHVSVGHPVLDQGTSLKYWVGFAFLLPKKQQ